VLSNSASATLDLAPVTSTSQTRDPDKPVTVCAAPSTKTSPPARSDGGRDTVIGRLRSG
jgi:hypothetical protein